MQLQDKVIEGFRLSPQQKRLWLLQQDSLAYRVQGAILLEGNLKKEVLKAALQQVINRHEILRTTFVRPMGVKTPIQVIADSSLPLWREVNLSGWDFQQQVTKIESLFQEERLLPFDFEQGSLLRSSLLTLSAHKHVLLLSLPALCADTWTLKNLVQEIGQSYDACLQGEELCDEVVQYIQFSEWQNQLLEDEDALSGEEYWHKQDFSALATLKLPFEAIPIAHSNTEVNYFDWKISPGESAKIEALVQQYGTDTSVFLLACWLVLLWRFTGQPDIVVGTACDGRKYQELKTAIGLFAKYLPLHCCLQDDYQFSEILKQVDEAVRDNSQWQEYFTWERFAELTGGSVDSSLLPFGFDFEEQPAKYSAAEVSFSIYKQYACIDRFKIKLSCIQQEDSLVAAFHYDTNFFCAEDVQRLAEHLQTLVESAIALPETAISQLEILSDRTRAQLLVFNDTQANFSKDKCIHQLFLEQAASTPNNIAVVFEQQQLTYAQLNARANKVAHHLQKLGVGPDVLVGICIERSLEMIVGVLGILKAGGAYLPLDPTFPTQNLAFRLQDAQAPVLLTHSAISHQHSSLSTGVVVCLDTDWGVIATEPDENPLCNATAENLVYAIYTSGSTGKPKGVAVEHQQLLNYLQGILKRLDLPTGASFATVSTFAADLGNTAIFSALCTGGCLHVVSSERASDPQALADYCRQHPIDCLKIVPSHLEALLASADSTDFLPRQRLILGGEACSWELIKKIQQVAPDCVIFNHYGPTETTVGVLTYQVEDIPVNPSSQTVPLGRPIANTQVYVLDRHLQPVPIGVPGELYIGGNNLARGYLNQPELTAERFICHSFSKEQEARLYKTGDLVRYRADGNLDFLGRIDDQVKIRGFRIELGEIEAVLCQHPGIQQAVALIREDEPGNKRLVAYVISHQDVGSTVHDWRSFLKERVPEYMVPSVFVRLKTLPLTPNGKVDRLALPAPDTIRPELKATFVPPREVLELQLIQIWEDILNVRPIGVTDNFFDLGGHSLLAVRLIAQIEKHFKQKLSLSTLLQETTVERLAGILRQQPESLSWSPLVGIQPQGSNKPFFCVHPIGGNVICYYNLANHLGSQQPFYGLEAPGVYGECEPYDRIEDLAAHYIKALRIVQPEGPYLLGGWSMGGVVAFEMAQQLQHQGQKVALLALLDTRAPVPGNKPADIDDCDDAKLLADIARATARFFGKNLSILDDDLRQLEPDKQLSYVLEIMKKANFVPPDIGLQQIRSFLQVSKSNTRALMSYTPKAYSGQITLFRSSKTLSDDDSEEISENLPAPVLGWSKLSSKPLDIHVVPGDHATIVAEPHVQVLAERLKACLNQAQSHENQS